MARAAVKRGLRLSVGSWNTIWMRLRIGSLANFLAGMRADILAVEHDHAVGLVDEAHHHGGGRRLAATGFADQADALAAVHREADAVDGAEHLGLRRGLALEDVLETAGHALAGIFLDQLLHHQQRGAALLRHYRSSRDSVCSPPAGRGVGWGYSLVDRHATPPPPQPSPTRGEGADRACGCAASVAAGSSSGRRSRSEAPGRGVARISLRV